MSDLIQEDRIPTPYAATDDEWSVAYTQFSKFCIWLAQNVCHALRVPRGNTDMIEDVTQELNIVLLKMIAKYKRQMYVVHCIEWFITHPDMIPDAYLHDVGYANFCWRFRSNLGANHGFSAHHDAIMAKVMSMIVAPVDFRWETQEECRRFLEFVSEDRLATLTSEERAVFDRYLNATRQTRWIRPSAEDQVAMNDMASKLSSLSTKPCRSRPFFLDRAFHPYVKRILMNWRNKYVSRRPHVDGVGYVSIDELGEAIPDIRVCSTNRFMVPNDPRYQHKTPDHDTFGYSLGHDVMESIAEEVSLEPEMV